MGRLEVEPSSQDLVERRPSDGLGYEVGHAGGKAGGATFYGCGSESNDGDILHVRGAICAPHNACGFVAIHDWHLWR